MVSSGVVRVLEPDFGDAVAGRDDPPLGRGIGDDAGVMLHVHRRGSVGDQLPQVRQAADFFQAVPSLQLPCHRDLVNGFAPLRHRDAGVEAELVPRPVEVLRLDQGQHPVQRVAVDQQPAQHRRLCVKIVRWLSLGVLGDDHG